MQVEGWIDLSRRAKFLLRGPDAERYLNGQTTQDVRRATPGLAMPSLITTAKGKIEADVFISRPDPDAFFIDGPAELREALQIRLDRYLIADDAELTDVTEEFGLVHVLGAEPVVPDGAVVRKANRYGIEGWDLLGGPGISLAQPGTALNSDDLEPVRIAHGIPRWGSELSADILPQEARLEERCLDFHKGCYIGQEVISRIKSVGKVNRLLCALVAEGAGEALAPGDLLFLEDREVGTITSVAKNAELGRITALAYVKRDAASPGTVLRPEHPEKRLLSRLEIRETPLCC